MLFLAALIAISSLDGFTPVSGFSHLDETATPNRFGVLLVAGEDEDENEEFAALIRSAVDSLPEEAQADLFAVTPDRSGYPDIAALCTDHAGLPAVLVLVGHCGYIQLDPQFLTVEIIDSWHTWGSHDARRTGICNFCRRCNP